MNSEQIFQLVLSLSEPWYVPKVEFLDGELQKELHLTKDYKAGFFIDKTGKSIVHDRVERKWRHQNFFEHKCFFIVKFLVLKLLKIRLTKYPFHGQGKVLDLLFCLRRLVCY